MALTRTTGVVVGLGIGLTAALLFLGITTLIRGRKETLVRTQALPFASPQAPEGTEAPAASPATPAPADGFLERFATPEPSDLASSLAETIESIFATPTPPAP